MFNFMKNIHDKKGGISQANLALEDNNCIPCESQQFDVSKMYTYLDNLAATATQ